MKSSLSKSLVLLGICAMSASAATIQVTGFNTDLIAESGNDFLAVTNGGVINGQEWTLASTGYTGTVSGTLLPITSDTVTTQNGTVFSVDPDANNALVNDGTLTLVAPGQYESLQFLLFMVSGDFTATLNFSDTSSTALTQTGITDWQTPSASNAFTATSNAEEIVGLRRLGTVGQEVPLNPREFSFTLSAPDQAKTIESITFDFSLNDRGSVMAVSGIAIPEPSSALLGGLGLLFLLRRRRA